jgi:hypothetical protein
MKIVSESREVEAAKLLTVILRRIPPDEALNVLACALRELGIALEKAVPGAYEALTATIIHVLRSSPPEPDEPSVFDPMPTAVGEEQA